MDRQENAAGNVFSIKQVGDEILAGNDELSEWARQRPGLFLKPDIPVLHSSTVVNEWAENAGYDDGRALGVPSPPRVVNEWAENAGYDPSGLDTFFQAADFYLVAHAHAHGYMIVTHEISSESTKHIKIPNACQGVSVECITPYEMLRSEHARFTLNSDV